MYVKYTWIPSDIPRTYGESRSRRPLPVGSAGNLRLRSFVVYLEYTWAA